MRLILGAIVGAVIVFIVSALLHMFSPLGMMGIGVAPTEEALMQAVRANVPNSGVYLFPGMDPKKTPTEADMKVWQEKLRAGPYGLLVVKLDGIDPMPGRNMLLEFLSVFAAALVAGFVLLICGGPYGVRALIPVLLALFAFFSLSLSWWIWYTFPLPFILGILVIEVIAWLLAGLVMAKIIRPRVVPA